MNKDLYREDLSSVFCTYMAHISPEESDTIRYHKKQGYSENDLRKYCIDGINYTKERFETFDYQTNNFGFRDCNNLDWYTENQPNEIWCFGCSFTFGVGVPIEYTWPSLIKNHTNMRIRNFGAPGAGVITAHRLLSNWLKVSKYKPKHVLMHGFFHGRAEIRMHDGFFLQCQGNSVKRYMEIYPLYKDFLYNEYMNIHEKEKRMSIEISKLAVKNDIDIHTVPILEWEIRKSIGRDNTINSETKEYQPHAGPAYYNNVKDKFLKKLDK